MRIVGQIASALYAVHQEGLVHRDVKPHNVLLWTSDVGEEHAFLTDFGLAKAVEQGVQMRIHQRWRPWYEGLHGS